MTRAHFRQGGFKSRFRSGGVFGRTIQCFVLGVGFQCRHRGAHADKPKIGGTAFELVGEAGGLGSVRSGDAFAQTGQQPGNLGDELAVDFDKVFGEAVADHVELFPIDHRAHRFPAKRIGRPRKS